MNWTLFRYWFFPKQWRLRTNSKRFAFLSVVAIVTALLSLLPLVLLPMQIGVGCAIYEEQLEILFFLLVNAACALAGATLITRERERGAREALTLTSISAPAMVCGKWLVRTLFAAGSIGLFVPFWLVLATVIQSPNDHSDFKYFAEVREQVSDVWMAARFGIFLALLVIRLLGHAVPFVSLGLLVSACCRKTRTAIAVTAGIVVLVLPITLYLLMSSVNPYNFTVAFSGSDNSGRFALACGLWPLLPTDFTLESSLISWHWASDLTADILWIVVLPAILLTCATYLCRRPERASKQNASFAARK